MCQAWRESPIPTPMFAFWSIFRWVFPKAKPELLPRGGRHQDKLPQGPRVTPQSQDAQSTSTYQILAAGLGMMLPSRFKASPKTEYVENRGATVLNPQGVTAWPQMCTGLPASTALTCVWVPSFLPLKTLKNFPSAQTSNATRVAPGFAPKPGSTTAFTAGSWERLVKLLKLLANLNLGLQ